jgi:Tol biopolymer transport system component
LDLVDKPLTLNGLGANTKLRESKQFTHCQDIHAPSIYPTVRQQNAEQKMKWGLKMRLREVFGFLTVVVIFFVTSAHAAFPGKNGRIAFISGADVYTMNADGSDVKQLTNLGPDSAAYWESWSPDGRQIVFVEFNPPDFIEQLWLMNDDGSNQHLLLAEDNYNDERPSFSPDGNSILFSRCTLEFEPCALYVVQVDGAGLHKVTDFQASIRDVSAEFSPDGKSIAFTSTGRAGIMCAIYLQSALRERTPEVTPPALTARQSDWSPDGSKLAFSSHCDPESNPQNQEIWVVDRGGSNLYRLTYNGQQYFAGPHDFFPSWSPDGNALVFERDAPDFSSSAIVVMNADGTGLSERLVLKRPVSSAAESRRMQARRGPAKKRHLREIEEGGALPRWGVAAN